MKNYKRTKFACYASSVALSAAFTIPPLLFITFREMYNISYTLLGTLVVINFVTQLLVDITFTFFTKYFNPKISVWAMPLIAAVGYIVYSVFPVLFPEHAYAGLCAGTVIFSVSAGLSEVLLSPVIAAMPSKTPDRDMSFLHSLYGYGVVFVVIISSIFFKLFGRENWMYLTGFWAIVPVICFILFLVSPFPEVNTASPVSADKNNSRRAGLLLCVMCIFLGGASECTMTQWVSGYMENALGIPKAAGDIIGMAGFAILLAMGRTVYAKFGKNISRVLTVSMAGAFICYITVALSGNVVVSAIACALTGLSTSMLWPGTLILMEEKFPASGVTAYALMAAGGDLGGSLAPQLTGIVIDKVSLSGWAQKFSSSLMLTPEQLGFKAGMLVASLFSLAGFILLVFMVKYFKRNELR